MRGLAYSSFPIVRTRNEDKEFSIGIFSLEILGRYPSGQRGQTVNLLPSAYKVRILACPPQQAMRMAVVSVEPGHEVPRASTLNITFGD